MQHCLSPAPQNPLCRKVLGSDPGQLSIGYYIYFLNLPKTIVLRSMLIIKLLHIFSCLGLYCTWEHVQYGYAILSPDELLL